MIKPKYYSWMFNNYINLCLSGYLRLFLFAAIISVISFLLFMMISIEGSLVFLLLVLGYMLLNVMICELWHRKARRMGITFFNILPGSKPWLEYMLKRRGYSIPLTQNIMELHVNTSSRHNDWEQYNKTMESDLFRINEQIKVGTFGKDVTIVFNSFNRKVIDKMEEIFFQTGEVKRIKGIAVPKSVLDTYKPNRFKKIQRKMFGEVKSEKIVDVPEAWEFLMYKN